MQRLSRFNWYEIESFAYDRVENQEVGQKRLRAILNNPIQRSELIKLWWERIEIDSKILFTVPY